MHRERVTLSPLKPNKQKGFTIVELLIVIVVIGILAAITVVAYTGIQQRAHLAALQSDLKSAVTQLGIDNVNNGTYPATVAAANGGKGLGASPGTTWQYTYTGASNSYCITGTNTGVSYFVSSDNTTPQSGACPGDVNGGGGGSNQIVDGSVTKPGWGFIYAISSQGTNGSNTEVQISVNTVNATQDGPAPISAFTNLPFLSVPSEVNNYSDGNGNTFADPITDAHIVGTGINAILGSGVSVIGYLDGGAYVHYLAFQDSPNSGTYNAPVPTASLPVKWSDWDGSYLMFKVNGVQQALQVNIASWADGAP